MSRTRTRRQSSQASSGPPSLDDIKDALDDALDERLDPITEMVTDHEHTLGEHSNSIEQLKHKVNEHDNLIKMVTGDTLGGALVRFGGAFIAFFVGLIVSIILDANGWKPVWWGLAYALIAFAVIGLVQLELGVRQHKNQQPDSDDSADTPSPDDTNDS